MTWLSADERNETFHYLTSAPDIVSDAGHPGKSLRTAASQSQRSTCVSP